MQTELDAVGSLIRRVWADTPRFNAWTFARFDIWSRWRTADAELDRNTGWQAAFACWDDAAAFIGEAPNDGVLVLAPSALHRVPELLRWVEEHADGALLVEANESNHALCEALARAGYEASDDGWYIPRVLELGERDTPVRLPRGYSLATIAPEHHQRYLDASQAVFGHAGFRVEAWRYLAGARSYHPELGVVALDADGVVASFACAWIDRALSVAEFEPVGTRPERQQLGLASALMHELENRLRRLGIRTATVHSWSTAEGANRLYDRLDYARVDRQLNWAAP